MKRSKPLKRSAIQRSKKKKTRLPKWWGELPPPTKRTSKERRAENFARCYHSEERVIWFKDQHCDICGRWPSENSHVKSKEAGGTYEDIVPHCHMCHREFHTIGIDTFEQMHDVDLAERAKYWHRAWQASL